ncbi:MAG: hypothetical protein GF363_09565 [Chitinivibrionales bacterium]|nr:hypothetical protein [Chitinivibrionales bacterium]
MTNPGLVLDGLTLRKISGIKWTVVGLRLFRVFVKIEHGTDTKPGRNNPAGN